MDVLGAVALDATLRLKPLQKLLHSADIRRRRLAVNLNRDLPGGQWMLAPKQLEHIQLSIGNPVLRHDLRAFLSCGVESDSSNRPRT